MVRHKLLPSIVIASILFAIKACSTITVETDDNFEVIELPDGSLAYLNHYSSLKYDENFDPRSIELNGEVYFDVTEGESPFKVDTEFCEIQVLGTKFNVRTNSEETKVEVEEGSVELKSKQDKNKIGRGESATYQNDGKGIKKGKGELEFKAWMKILDLEFKKLGKEIKRSSKQIGKESKEVSKELKKEIKELKKR